VLLVASASLTTAAVIVVPSFPTFTADFCHVLTVLAHLFTALAANFRHVLAVLAYRFTALAACFGVPFRVSMPPTAFSAVLVAALAAALAAALILVALLASAGMVFLAPTALISIVCHDNSLSLLSSKNDPAVRGPAAHPLCGAAII
jgi:hypothetical protein